MIFNYEDYLHKIDLALKEKKQTELYMTYMLVVMTIFAFAYFLFWQSSFTDFQTTRKNVLSLKRNINSDKHYLQLHPASRITQLNKEIQKIDKNIIKMRDANSYIKSKIETISSLIYDERTWGEYLDSISTNAQKYNMKLLSFTNEYSKSESSFGHVLDIYINTTGDFQNSIKFINALEQSDLVVDIHNFRMNSDDNLQSELNISVWGIKY